ncbi:hypothetical protein LCGC14_1019340 [marine sediment metagenome]|uniref:Uncharacterized protein n=1 Tax=marine sediment metagenome TaxID=412755 RepID=A0A0F9N2F3_9ZZZZ
MALVRAGALVGQISGSIGSNTFSRNRYGAYVRNRTVPITSTTQAALEAKNRLTAASQAWGALTSTQHLNWETWAQNNPITNRLGEARVLQGNAAYVELNTRILRLAGAQISEPPSADAPDALLTAVVTYDIGLGGTDITFTGTPLAAGVHLWAYFAVMNSDGINYFENLYKLAETGAAAQASPLDYLAAVEARFGTLVVGQKVAWKIATADSATGLISSFLVGSGNIITT